MKNIKIKNVAQLISSPSKKLNILFNQLVEEGILEMPNVNELVVNDYKSGEFKDNDGNVTYWTKLVAINQSQYDTLVSIGKEDSADQFIISLPLSDHKLIKNDKEFSSLYEGNTYLQNNELVPNLKFTSYGPKVEFKIKEDEE